jgi:hypothetical protein
MPRFVQSRFAGDEHTDVTLQPPIRWHIIILHGRPGLRVPGHFWRSLAAMLEPGGMLFVCNLKDPSLARQIRAASDTLHPGEWHLIEAAEEGKWRLRPDAWQAEAWFNRHLSVPLGLRSWLRQSFSLWLPYASLDAKKIQVLPVSRDQST